MIIPDTFRTPLEALNFLFEQYALTNRNMLDWREVRDLMAHMRREIERFNELEQPAPTQGTRDTRHGRSCVCGKA